MGAAGQYYYQFQVGAAEFERWGLDDVKARRLLARWLRLAWPRFRARMPAGSIAQAINDGWYDQAPTAMIGRTWTDGSVIPCVAPTIIEKFDADEIGIREFCRVAR